MSQFFFELKPGMVLDNRYELREFLGRGAFGAVYRAHDRDLDIDCALKLLSPQWTGDSEHVQRFKHEIRIGRKIRHVNVCQIYDFGEFQDIKFISMEFVEGQNLTARLRSEPPLSLAEKMQIVLQVCEALGAAHRAGVVHRDLKLDNIMLDRQGRAKVMDFGIARATDMTRLTATDKILGTTQYMPPEQWRGEEVDARADIYALGVLMYVLFAGRPPFEGSSHVALFYQHLNQPPPPLLSLRPDLPPLLGELVESCLAKDREDRPSSTESLAHELAEVPVDGVERPGRPTKTLAALRAGSTETMEPGKPARGRTGGLALAAGLILAAFGAAALWLPRDPAAPPISAPTPVATLAAVALPAQGGAPSATQDARPASPAADQASPPAPAADQPSPPAPAGPEAPVRQAPEETATTKPAATRSQAPRADSPTVAPAQEPELDADSAELRDVVNRFEGYLAAGDRAAALALLDSVRLPPARGLRGRERRKEVSRKIEALRAKVAAQLAPSPMAAPAPASKGLVRLRVDVWANVRVDGQDAGTTPRPPIELSAGPHRIVLENPETQGRVERTVEVKAGETVTLDVGLLYGELEIQTEPQARASVKLPDGTVRDLGMTPVTAELPGGRDVQLLLESGGTTRAFIVRVPGGGRQTFRKTLGGP